ncbi:MAG TPA: FAD-dependent oxidoreductase, partial [Gemmatimonadota bacterium]|nr:FAD-dependent oxidoreductase [Gemmatimonadota bacterium]
MTRAPRMIVLGAGPIGLQCLLRARGSGWEADAYESGRVGESVRRWGHVRMFSPWRMNVSAAGKAAVGLEDVDPEGLPTGAEYVTRYLAPLAASPLLAGRVHLGTEVMAVSRGRLLKGDAIASDARRQPRFRVLLRDGRGERVEEADVVVDATGTYATPNRLGPGGIPAVGERAARGIEHRIPDIEGRDRAAFAGRRTLVVGAGHSAATAIVALEALARETPRTRVVWLTRSEERRPIPEVSGDPLAERARIAGAANQVAGDGEGWLERLPGTHVDALHEAGFGYRVTTGGPGGGRTLEVDRVLALVGYRPDPDLARELQVQTCWATEGTYPLAAALLSRAGQGSDCLEAGRDLDASTLRHPEPGFFTLGMKSYGRNPDFLLQVGFKQVDD